MADDAGPVTPVGRACYAWEAMQDAPDDQTRIAIIADQIEEAMHEAKVEIRDGIAADLDAFAAHYRDQLQNQYAADLTAFVARIARQHGI
jgi:hypothetical protein